MVSRRILVAEAPHRAEATDRAVRVPAAIGVLPWSDGRSWLGIFVAAAWTWSADDPLVDGRPRLVPVDGLRPHAGPPDEARPRPDDFVPLRERVDVAVVGSAEIVPTPSGRFEARRMAIGLGERTVTFVAEPPHAGKVALKPPVTRHLDGRAFDPRPRACHDGAASSFLHEDGFDMGAYQSAPPELQLATPPDGAAEITLLGVLSPDARAIVAPPLRPAVALEYAESGGATILVPLFLDHLVIDLDERRLEASWRGHAEIVPPAHRDVDRLLVAWGTPAAWRDDAADVWRRALRELPRGSFGHAWERDDALRGNAPPPLDEHELAMARHETWDFPEAPEPEMELDRYATIAAELAEQREPRGDVLARHGVDDYAWSVEDRAWAQKVATADDDADTAALRERFGAALRDARARLATPREAELSPERWVELVARIQRGDPTRELARAGFGLGAYLRMDAQWKARAAEDPALAEELERLRDAVDERLESEPLESPFADQEEDDDR